MTTYENIMVAVDGSKEAEAAFNKALNIAKVSGATLHIAHIIDIRRLTTVDPYSVSLAEAQKHGENLLNKYVDQAKAAGYENVIAILESGSPKRDIPMTIAQKYAIDLILCGATGLNAIDRFLIGSVSEQIVRHAKCDVLVVRK